MKKLPFESGRTRATKTLQLVHADIAGPITPQSREGYKYWLMLVDDFTGRPWIYFAKRKSEVDGLLKQWRSDVEAYFRTKLGNFTLSENWLEFLRSDRKLQSASTRVLSLCLQASTLARLGHSQPRF